MVVSNDFSSSELDLNGKANIGGPTALVWGPDGRLYVTEVSGDVNVLSVAFGDKDPSDDQDTAQFYVTDAVTLDHVKGIQNYNDDGTEATQTTRQVTGIDVTKQYDSVTGEQVFFEGKPAVVIYVTSSDSRIGAGGNGADQNLDTNSGVITRLTEQANGSFVAVDIVRGLSRSEENHATNGLEVIQELDVDGNLVSERMIVANGGNANTGAPSNNFAGQQETPTSAAILEVDLTQLNAMGINTDPDGRMFIYDLPTLNDPTRDDLAENDPHGGNDGLNSAILTADSPVQIYSAGYRNAFDVEVTDDGRVFTYDNGANNNWGGRPAGEDQDGDVDAQEAETGTPDGYIATNLFVEDNNEIAGDFNPQNWDSLHEVTRSDDLAGRILSAGQGGAQTYTWDHPDFTEELTLVYGGHPNPTRAEGARAGILYSPDSGTGNAKLMVSNVAKTVEGGGQTSDFLEVVAWLLEIGYDDAFINATVVALDPGVTYSDTFADGFGGDAASGRPTVPDVFSLVEDSDGSIGLPSDIDTIVHALNPIEGNYLEAGYTDGSIDTNKGSVNGLTEYTSTILDNDETGVKMSGALWASTFNGSYLLIGRDEDGTVATTTNSGRTVAENKTTIQADGGPLGLAAIGDDLTAFGGEAAFQGSVWAAIYKENGPVIEIFQPGNPDTNALLPVYAGQVPSDPTDHDLDGIDHINDPFDYSADNGYALGVGEALLLDFQTSPPRAEFSASLGDTGILGAALDGVTPNRDALTLADGFTDPNTLEDGLFDIGGNLINGANAPKAQIKEVADGSAKGAANNMLDGLQTGVRIDDDVKRLVANIEIANWTADQPAVDGRKTGLMFGDGTQFNFVRVFFGDIGGGVLGLEVGLEDQNTYTVLGTVTDAAFTAALTGFVGDAEKILFGQKAIQLQLEISDIGGTYEISARYAVKGETALTEIPLTNANLPTGSLQNVLNGTHQISDGDTAATSGASVGLFAEKNDGITFTAVDFNEIRIEAFGNEIIANDAAGVGSIGTDGTDTVIYDGSDTELGALDASVENFDGSGSAADFRIAGNDNDNVITVGSGNNEITTGEGADVVKGTLNDLGGDKIMDFSTQDAVVITGFSTADIVGPIGYAEGSAVVTINGQSLTFEGPDFVDFEAAAGPDSFTFTDTAEGLRITSREPLTPVVAINAGGVGTISGTLRETELSFIGDEGGAIDGPGFTTPGATKLYTNAQAAALDFPDTDLDGILASERSNGAAFGYEVPVPNGTYLVDLIFAEIYFGLAGTGGAAAGVGSRVFDGEIEGVQVFDNLDIFVEAGGAGKQLIKSYQVEVTDGSLSINLPAVTAADGEVNQAKLAGLVVWDVGGGFVPVDGTAPVIEEISLENPFLLTDGPRDLTVVLTDETGFSADDFAGFDGDEITFTDYTPDDVSGPTVVLSNADKTATLTYVVTPTGDTWVNGTVGQISIAPNTFTDAAGNGNAAASNGFVVQSNLDALDRGAVVRAINLGTNDQTPGVLAPDPLDGDVVDNNRYGGALTDTIIVDAFGKPVTFEADSDAYHTSPKASQNANVDGNLGATGSNGGGVDLDGSAYHTYRDSSAADWTSTYTGFENGSYIVELHFAELFWTAAGERVGDFTVNGRLIDAADDYDAFAASAGADKPSFIRVPVTVTDGTISVNVTSSAGQAGYSAIVVYDAVDSTLPPSVSVADVTVAEGGVAEVTFTRTGDLSEAVTIDYTVTAGTAEASEFGAATPTPVIIAAGQATATISFQINDDDIQEGAETIVVTITDANVPSATAVGISDASATVTIAANDSPFQAPVGASIFNLDFEGPDGEATDVGGFDGTLGDEALTEDTATSEITGGKLVVQTAEGDINDSASGSINDFTRIADVSDPTLTEIFLTTKFDNPFTQAEFADQGITDGRLPNYAQQGIVFGTGTQMAGELVKLVLGGVAAGTTAPDALGVQMWTKGQGNLDQAVLFAAMVPAGTTQFGVASIEMSLVIDKTDGTVGMYVTLFDDIGAILGGVRPEPTTGFATAAPLPLPAAVLANLISTTEPTHFGVTSSDNTVVVDAFTSFDASWDYLNLSSPEFDDAPVADSVDGTPVAGGDFSNSRTAPTDILVLAEGETEIVATQQGDNAEGGRDRDFITFTVAEGQELTGIVIKDYTGGFENGAVSQGFMAIQEGTVIDFDQDNPVPEAIANLLGSHIYSAADVQGSNFNDGNVLDEMGSDQGNGSQGFTGALQAGTYTLWLNQGADVPKTVTLDLVTSAVVLADVTLSISDAPLVAENGDDGTTTTLAFTITADDLAFSGDVTVTYDVGAQNGLTQAVTFTDGIATLNVDVPNDDIDSGISTFAVTLTQATGGAAFGINPAASTASGAVVEDDVVPTFVRGDVVYAVNAGGPMLTQDGIEFEAGPNAAPFIGGSSFTDNNGGNGQQPAFDGTVYESEVNGDADGSFEAAITFPDIDPDTLYFIDLYFAEIYATDIGNRIFDIAVEGVAPDAGNVLNDIDVLARNGNNINTPLIIQVPEAVTPGANNTIDLSFIAGVDRAKISAIVIREAVLFDPTAVDVSVADVTVSEEAGTVDVTFAREGNLDTDMVITFSTSDDTATADADYSAVSGQTVTILAGQTTVTTQITLLGDEEIEGNEAFNVTINSAEALGATVSIADADATVTLIEDDFSVGFAPNEDLDSDGIVNADDDDVDGDGVLNGVMPESW